MSTFDFCGLCLIVISVGGAIKAYQDNQLLKTNPDAWKAQKEIEAAEKERKRKHLGDAAVTGFKIARLFFWK